jgi:hypothetical protein
LRHLSHVNIGGNGGGGLLSSGRSFLLGNLLLTFFLRRSVKKFRGSSTWLENGSDLNCRHLSHVNIGGNGGGGLVSISASFSLRNLLSTFF